MKKKTKNILKRKKLKLEKKKERKKERYGK